MTKNESDNKEKVESDISDNDNNDDEKDKRRTKGLKIKLSKRTSKVGEKMLDKENKAPGKSINTCTIYFKNFITRLSLKSQIILDSGESLLKCEKCGFASIHKSAFKVHLAYHLRHCHACKEGFKTMKNLLSHRKNCFSLNQTGREKFEIWEKINHNIVRLVLLFNQL